MKTIIGIMGSGENSATIDMTNAKAFAQLVADKGWVVLTGGRPFGVMRAAHEGAKAGEKKGTVVGILPSTKSNGGACELVDIAIYTGLGDARNAITGQSPDVVVAFVEDAGPGTISEIALACKSQGKQKGANPSKADHPVVLVGSPDKTEHLAACLGRGVLLFHAIDFTAAMKRVESLV
jgi:uncharacterized protein (TIGR00725 family)